MKWGKIVELFEHMDTLVYEKIIKGQDRTLISLGVCVASLAYCLETEIPPNHIFLVTLGFAALHMFGIFIFTQQWFSNFLQNWGSLVFPLVGVLKAFGNGYVMYYVMAHKEHANWRLLVFVLSYATFHFLLMINEIGGRDFGVTRGFLAAAFTLAMFIQQQKTFGVAIVLVVSTTLVFFKECHIQRMTLQCKATTEMPTSKTNVRADGGTYG
ncbi:uncharacterized protein LOC111006450 [Momordica charantia]|uniref:Uncharacterized protein LOC111006450 n=1 Tax=Momordica charantia TaxID=3673 RepID=A0A6J1BX40_MOMCH|nr:uncharacterized protein LOC111006450 [Momordica charantia]